MWILETLTALGQFVVAYSVTVWYYTPRDDFDGFERVGERPDTIVTMTEYEDGLPVTVAFPPQNVHTGLSEYLASVGKRQLKVAETEKYAHVTFFFNGGREDVRARSNRPKEPSFFTRDDQGPNAFTAAGCSCWLPRVRLLAAAAGLARCCR